MAEKFGRIREAVHVVCGAPEKDLEWSEESIEGRGDFESVYRLVEKHESEVASGEWLVASGREEKKPKTTLRYKGGAPQGNQEHSQE